MPRKTSQYPEARELKNLGRAIRTARKVKGIAQEDLAHLADIDRSYFGAIERGEVNVTLMVVIRIASALNIPVSELTIGIEQQQDC